MLGVMSILWFSIIALWTYIIYKIVQTVNYMKLVCKIPGPKSVPIIGNCWELQTSPEKMFQLLSEYSKQYFPMFRISAGYYSAVFINSPEDTEIVISGTKHLEKSKMYECLHIWLKSGLLTSTGDKWHSRRKILTPTFHFNILQQFSTTIVEKSEKLAQEFENFVGQELNIVPIITEFTLLTICETAMGTDMKGAKAEKYIKAVHKMGQLTIYILTRPWYFVQILHVFTIIYYQRLFASKYLHNYSKNIIMKRQKDFNPNDIPTNPDDVYKSKKRLAMLDMLLYAKSMGDNIDFDGIREEVDTFMFEGHDTTTSCISFTLMLLACNKEVQDKAMEEINDLLPNETDKLTFEVLNNMKYLERVIKESLRLYPSVPMFGRLNGETVITHDGQEIPPGTNIIIRAYEIHRNPSIYPNPEKFDPDRFLPENSKNRHPYAYIPFSAGPRNCIGQKFAFLELKAMISSILRKFELHPVDNPETLTLVTDIILRTKDGIRVKFQRRAK